MHLKQIPLALTIAAAACAPKSSATPTSAAPPRSTPATAEDPPADDAWARAVRDEAEDLQRRFPDAQISIAVADVASGRLLASRGPLDEPHDTGSTMKAFTVAAALAAGVSPDDELDCDDGQTVFEGTTIQDHAAHGVVSVREAFARSSNVAIVRLAERVGVRPLYDAVAKMVALPPAEDVDDPAAVLLLFGGTSKLTTRQLVDGYAMLARGGTESSGGEALVDPGAAAALGELLEQAVTTPNGTGKQAAVHGVPVGGKTGTADNPSGRTALFFGVARPPNAAPVVVGVVVQGVPQDQYGGNLAAPAFAAIVREAAAP